MKLLLILKKFLTTCFDDLQCTTYATICRDLQMKKLMNYEYFSRALYNVITLSIGVSGNTS